MRTITLLFLIAIFATTHAADWTTFRGAMTRTGFCKSVVLVPQTRTHLWEINVHGEIISSPVIKDGVVYVGCRDSAVYAIDAETGAIRWRTKTGGWVDATPLIRDNYLIVGGRNGIIHVLDRQTGTDVQQINAGVQISSPGLAENGIVVSGIGHPRNLLAKLPAVFSSDTASNVLDTLSFPQPTFSTPALFGHYAVIGDNNGFFYNIDLLTMKDIWKVGTNGAVLASTPAIDDSTVYFASCDWDRNVYAVDLATGHNFWKADGLSKAGLRKQPVKNMIRPKNFLKLLKFDPQTRLTIINRLRKNGTIVPPVLENPGLAKRSSASAAAAFYGFGDIKSSSVAVDSNNVYVIQREDGYPTSEFTILALDKYFGDLKWQFSEFRTAKPMWLCSSPLATPKFILAGWGEGKLYAFDPKTGNKLWEDSLNGDIVSSPALADSHLVVATLNGQICAYKLAVVVPPKTFMSATLCFPNPARKLVSHIQVYAEYNASIDIIIYNPAEKPVINVSGRALAGSIFLYDWNISRIANGVYFAYIKVHYENGKSEKKILKVAILR